MQVTRRLEIEAPFLALLTLLCADVPVMRLNSKSQITVNHDPPAGCNLMGNGDCGINRKRCLISTSIFNTITSFGIDKIMGDAVD